MITVDNVSMLFNLSTEKIDNIKEYVIRVLKGNLKFREFWALKNVSFSINRGDALGIVGLNGAGKSTLLKLIAGVLKPTQGTIKTGGSIAPLIELGAGFDGDLSARENVYLNGAILGYSHQYMENKFNSIIEFAELENFIDVPIKNFSSGMTARLGFAIATMNQPDILILDEVLSVGDHKFKQKSFARTQEIIKDGATVLFVSHAPEQVKQLCNKALWLEKGTVKMFGDANSVCTAYANS
ncbi:MAG: ABC transporter ATP-binding protein [Dehalobacterium sp.]